MPDPFTAKILRDPPLTFGGGHIAHDQKVGIANFGPYSQEISVIRAAIIGDDRTTKQFLDVIEMAQNTVPGKTRHPLWTQDFPGLGRDSGFRIDFVAKDEWVRILRPDAVKRIQKMAPLGRRIQEAVSLFTDEIQKLQGREGGPNLFICAPPEDMMKFCLPLEGDRGSGPKGKTSRLEKKYQSAAGHENQRTLGAFSPDVAEQEQERWQQEACDNFHHALKIRAMDLDAATQFVKPFTLDKILSDDPRGVQDRGTFCWNIFTACYYKVGGAPWKLDIPQGTCFIGIAFFFEKKGRRKIGTSLAQVFTHDGEGLVVRGESFEWPKYSEPHLSRASMRKLVEKALETYSGQMEGPPRRVVIHKTSGFDDDEAAGARDALADVPRHDFVAIRSAHGHKVFRSGYNPAVRGTAVDLPDGRRLLFTRGYVPSMQVYPGPRVPRPIEIQFQETSTSRDQLSAEILGLTRLNWNSADFSSRLPMTLQFAKQVNTILREMPPGTKAKSRYRYYM